MTLISQGKKAPDHFNPDFTLISSRLIKLDFESIDGELIIKLTFSLQYPKDKIIFLEFRGIERYSFTITDSNYFYNETISPKKTTTSFLQIVLI